MPAAIVFGVVIGLVVWRVSKDALARTPIDGHHLWVPVATFGAAGLGWGLAQIGPRRFTRAALGAVGGGTAGAAGGMLLGTTKTHLDAAQDEVLSGGSLGRALLWALIGAAAWAVTLGAASPPSRMWRVAGGGAVGGAAIGAAMGLLAGTPLGSDSPILTDAWWSGWIVVDDNVPRLLPALIAAVVLPVAGAGWVAAARRPLAPLVGGAAACLVLPGLALLAGRATDLDTARRDGGVADFPGFESGRGDPPPAISVPGPTIPDLTSPHLPTVPDLSTVPTVTTPATAPLETSPPDTAPATEPPATVPAGPPPPVTVATDTDPGFPVIIDQRFSANNTVNEGLQARLLVGQPYHPADAPSSPDAGTSCAAGHNDAVIPYYLQVTPYDAPVSRVLVTFSQGVHAAADTGNHPLTVELHDRDEVRCQSAVDGNLTATGANVVWETLADGESGSEYGYFVVANYFDDTGGTPGKGSALLATGLELNRTQTTWSFEVHGTSTLTFQGADGSYGDGIYLVP